MALLSGSAFGSSFAAHTVAQAQAAPAEAGTESAPVLQEVVVTGSRITSPNLESVSPITAVSAELIANTGTTRIEDLLNSLPQVVADQNSGLSMGTSGVANIDLRGLGVARTLVLIDGRRVIGGDPTGGGANIVNLEGASAADVNQIPVALIERVDVLTGGASSTYGADAVAGVVNFIMNQHFDGFRVDANIGIFNHDNHQAWLSPIFEASGFAPVTGTNWDGANKDLTLILGNSFADGAGHFEGYLGYQRQNPVAASHRDHSACGVSATGTTMFSCAGSSNSAPSVIKTADLSTNSQVSATGNVVGQYNHFNFANYFYLQRQDERYTAGFFGNLKLNEHAEAYTEFMFMDDQTRGNYGPAGLFFGSGFSVTPAGNPGAGIRNGSWTVNCGVGAYGNAGMNPYLTQNEFGTLCAAGSPYPQFSLPNGDIQLVMARRNVEGGPREDTYSHTTWRGVFGFKGAISTDWTYDTSLTYSVVRTTDSHTNDTSSRLMQDAMIAVKDPATGQIVCRSGSSGCIPWNIWNPAGPSAGLAVPYFSVPGLLQGFGSEQIWTTFVDGDLTHAGVKLPTADDGLKVVVGTEYRQEAITFTPDAELIQGDLAGIGSPTIGYAAGFHVWEGFTEARMPLVRNVPGFQVLDLEGGYRYSSYTSGFNTNTYKIGLAWAPVKDVRLRASYNQAVRAPNAAELGKPTYVALDGSTDLCASTAFSAAQCAQTGLLASQYPASKSPANQYNGQIGGNPNLQPETGKTKVVGIVFTPTFLPGFSASVDYADFKITNLVSSYGPQFIQSECIATGSPFWCSSNPPAYQPGIHRNAVGSLWSNPQGYVIDPLVNTGGEENKSVDVGVNYRQSIGSAGTLRARLDGTYLLHLYFTPGGPNPTIFDCAGRFGVACSPATPSFRMWLPLDWDTPVKGFSFGATWRYYGPVTNTFLDPKNPDYQSVNLPIGDPRLPSISYIDLRASYVFGKATLRVGCNNVGDKDPPIISLATAGNGTQASANTYPGVYDTSGRYLYANLTVDF